MELKCPVLHLNRGSKESKNIGKRRAANLNSTSFDKELYATLDANLKACLR
jgi:hypothetical protein